MAPKNIAQRRREAFQKNLCRWLCGKPVEMNTRSCAECKVRHRNQEKLAARKRVEKKKSDAEKLEGKIKTITDGRGDEEC